MRTKHNIAGHVQTIHTYRDILGSYYYSASELPHPQQRHIGTTPYLCICVLPYFHRPGPQRSGNTVVFVSVKQVADVVLPFSFDTPRIRLKGRLVGKSLGLSN